MNKPKLHILLSCALGSMLLVGTLLLLRPSLPAYAQTGAILYVAPNGDDSGSCTDPDAPCRTVQYAVDQANSGDGIRIAGGTYSDIHAVPAPGYYPFPPSNGMITQTVYLDKTLILRGGYTTTDWTVSDPQANPTILDAQGQGRVLYITGNITPTIENMSITGGGIVGGGFFDTAYPAGGGIYVITATATISNCQIFSNTSSMGCGAYIRASASFIFNSSFFSNTGSYGGGLFLDNSQAVLDSNTISSNTVTFWGGGLFAIGSDPSFSSNRVLLNSAREGGGLYLARGAGKFANNVIAQNDVTLSGSGLYIAGYQANFLHNTIADNNGGDGSGLFVRDFLGMEYTNIILTNTVLVSHTVGITATSGNTIVANGILWYGNLDNVGGMGAVTTTQAITGDPAFVDPVQMDYHIGWTSAAIDNGVNSGIEMDIDGQNRPFGSRYDLGADENWWRVYLPVVSKAPFNLLRNPDFEESFAQFAHYSSVIIAPPWTPWWQVQASDDPTWKNRMPEYKPATTDPGQVHSGQNAQLLFTYYGTHVAGLYQQVTGIKPGSIVEFSIWGYAWAGQGDDPNQSESGGPMHMRIGIDPTRQTDPFSANVVWSDEQNPLDTWAVFFVKTQAVSNWITIFTYSAPEHPTKHNAVFWDDAFLVAFD